MSHPLQDRVRSIDRRVRRLFALYGVMAFLAVVVAALLVVGLSDYVFRFQDFDNFYYAKLDIDGFVGLFTRENGTWEKLVESAKSEHYLPG